jgi:hypothetical protein
MKLKPPMCTHILTHTYRHSIKVRIQRRSIWKKYATKKIQYGSSMEVNISLIHNFVSNLEEFQPQERPINQKNNSFLENFGLVYIYIIIYNNNLFLRSRPSQTPNWCMRPLLPSDLTGKVYGGIHTLPPLDLNL